MSSVSSQPPQVPKENLQPLDDIRMNTARLVSDDNEITNKATEIRAKIKIVQKDYGIYLKHSGEHTNNTLNKLDVQLERLIAIQQKTSKRTGFFGRLAKTIDKVEIYALKNGISKIRKLLQWQIMIHEGVKTVNESDRISMGFYKDGEIPGFTKTEQSKVDLIGTPGGKIGRLEGLGLEYRAKILNEQALMRLNEFNRSFPINENHRPEVNEERKKREKELDEAQATLKKIKDGLAAAQAEEDAKFQLKLKKRLF